MLTFNKLTGVFVRRRHSFSTELLLVLWFFLYLSVNLTTSDTLFTTAFRIQHDPYSFSNFPEEQFTISGTPITPTQLLQSLSQATTQAVLARAARAANPNRGVPTQPAAPVPLPVFIPAPVSHGAPTYFSDSDDETMAQQTPSDDPLAYKNAFKEGEFILRQAMKARITKQGTRTDDELLAFQTDQVVEAAQLNSIQMQKVMELQTSTHDLGPIKAGTHMQNKRMAPAKWDAVKDILHRIILITRVLRVPSDSRNAREKLKQMHEDIVQDTERGIPFLLRFNQYFDISGIHDTEYQHYVQQSMNGTEHPKM